MTTTALTPASRSAGRTATWIASIHVAALALQLALALLVLSGASVNLWHADLAWVVTTLGVAQALAALAARARLGPLRTLFAIAIPVLEGLQIWLGRSGQTGAHALLALLIWSLAIAVLIRLAASLALDAGAGAGK